MKKVFIYGGCTSRDAVDYYDDYGLSLHSYIARQSLISAFDPARATLWDFKEIKSSFQRRMFRGDIVGSLPSHLNSVGSEIDLMVWDLMIERVGVRPIRGGGTVTNNPGTRKYVLNQGQLGDVVAFGSDKHFELWSKAFQRLTTVLRSVSLFDRTIVNATPWALVDKFGSIANYPSSGFDPEWFNKTVRRYLTLIESSGVRVIKIDQKDAIADPDHKWGAAYFHYIPQTYHAQLEALAATL